MRCGNDKSGDEKEGKTVQRQLKNAAIRVENLGKSFKDVRAVDGVSFSVEEGELFAFLGENGAGKSTSIAMICGLLSSDRGKIYILGKDIDEERAANRHIGVVFQNSVLDKALSARDNLASRAALYGIVGDEFQKRLSRLNDLLDFSEYIDRPLAKLSGGQRRKIDVARALIHDPKILILDEPTTGLDPQTRKTVWGVVERLRRERGMTVFLTTHYMEEAARADYVVILDRGKVAAEGTPRELKNRYTGDFVWLYGVDEEGARCAFSEAFPRARRSGDAWKLAVGHTAEAAALIAKNADLFADFEVIKGNMDDVFLAVTGKTLSKEDGERNAATKNGKEGRR